MRKVLLFLIVLSGFSICRASADIGVGGSIDTTVVGTIDSQDNFETDIWNRANIELLLPERDKTSSRFEVDIYQAGAVSDFFIRSLYLRRRFETVQLTAGRQPVSWSFGSLFNPVDFTLGAELAGVERTGKFSDGVELYIPLSWNASFAAVGSVEPLSGEIKSGARLRGGIMGYDASLNFIYEPVGALPELDKENLRAGLSLKGDLGPLGIYGALAGRATDPIDRDISFSGLGGADYSFNIRNMHTVNIQAEYINLEPEIAGSMLGAAVDDIKNIDLLAGSLNFGISDFTSVGLTSVIFLNEDSVVWAPYFKSDLGGNLVFTLKGGYLSGENIALFGQTVFEEEIPVIDGIIQAGLSYTF